MDVRRVLPALALAALLTLTGCEEPDFVDDDQPADRVEALEKAHRQGKESQKDVNKVGVLLEDEAQCSDAYYRLGYDTDDVTRYKSGTDLPRKPDTDFAELRRLSFINGCLGRPNDLPAINLPSPGTTPSPGAPSPATSPSPSTSASSSPTPGITP